MSKEIITFGDIKIEKHKFYFYNTPIFSEDADIKNVLVPKKISSAEKIYKYFIGCLCDWFIGCFRLADVACGRS